ncbi:restriction endonuclease subunit S [Chryseobacterium sp. BIGb0232]|uniref:restriction endonuclease subunit S n=1 Tax=Chryseobacterium sp. BIGb0232 TaxID=2940598 RepID=UPI000F46C79D|nr:restriction endonuclease subunit S [Chryseobacterium sp. BIGb0232]MCS4301205.1 type I restriction enzyme S subunit [Chryseobacterium sp. BIGb0232]ROS19934.1 type I restriction enzyme S subunit [Chryseobacterium nakagawai]
MENNLPKNWIEVNLKDSVNFRKGKKPKILSEENFDNSLPYRDIQALESEVVRYYADKDSSKHFKENDIVIVWDGSRSGLILKSKKGAIGSTLGALNPYIYKSEYLYYFLLSQYEIINSKARGVGIPHVDPTYLWGLSLPLPPLPEQERIVAKLDALFAQHEAMKKALERIPQLLKDFRQQVLTHAVTGKLTEKWREKTNNLVEWELKKLNEISLSITDGDHQAPPKSESGVPFLVISNISDGKLNFNHISRYVPINYYEKLKDIRKPNTGDILYTVTGSYGIPVLVNEKIDFCFQRHIAIIKPDPQKVYNIFLYYYLKSQNILEQAKECATGTAQLTVPLSGLRKFILKVPTILEQHEIINRIENLFSKADIIEERYKNLKEKIDSLPQAILHKAFKGELVPQLPTDGDAKDLLEEILKLKKEVKKK